MKRNIVNIILASLLFFLGSCMDERENDSFNVEEGRPVTLDITYGAGAQDVINTKGALEDGDVYDLYVLIFNSKGERLYPDDGKSYFTFSKSNFGSVSIKTTTGKKYIYGVANVDNAMIEDMKSILERISNRSELQNLSLKLNQEIIQFSTDRFPMSGYFTSGSDIITEPAAAELIQIAGDDNGKGFIKNMSGATIEGSIKLVRLFSTVKFVFSHSNRCESFVPTTWDVINVPSTTNLYKQESEPVHSSYYENTKMNRYTGSSFEFAMFENLKRGTKAVDANSRENRTIAPLNSTYVVLRGHYIGLGKKYNDDFSEVQKPDAKVEADVTYYISLGKGAAFASTDKNDYNSERNKKYTYNLNIVGIDQIITEVVEEPPYHRADGDVTYTEGTVEVFDAHYATKVYSFTKDDLSKGVEFQTKTPFSGGRFLALSRTEDANMADCWDWVYFMVNAKNSSSYSSTAQKYPGDIEKGKKLMTVSQFRNYLSNVEDFGVDGKLKVTCFIDEYYYPKKHWSTFVNQEPRVLQILCKRKEGNNSSLTDAKYIISQKAIYTVYDTNPSLATAWGIEWTNETGRVSNFGTTTASDWDNGRANMITNGISGKNWYASGSSYSEEFKKAYAACMSRNRDDNGDSTIDKNEIKWYLPAINQYMDIWMGTDGLPYGFPLYQGSGEWDHFISSTARKIMWGEEGSSFGNANDGGDNWESKNLRCIRNLGMNDSEHTNSDTEKPDFHYSFNSTTRVFNLKNMNAKSLRPQFIESGELDAHKHTDSNNKNLPYKAFKVSKDKVQHIYETKSVIEKKYPSGGYNAYSWGEGYYVNGVQPAGEGWTRDASDRKYYSSKYYYRWYRNETVEKNVDLGNQVTISKVKELLNTNQSPCKKYSEDEVTGWRLPNQRELQMMVIKRDALGLVGSGNGTGGPYTFSFTEFNFTPRRYFVYGGNLRLTDPVDDPKVYIRCVKDVNP